MMQKQFQWLKKSIKATYFPEARKEGTIPNEEIILIQQQNQKKKLK